MDSSGGKKYVCFSCLKESTDPGVCSQCGAKIDHFDLTSSKFIPPVKGVVKIKKTERSEKVVKDVVEDLEKEYHDEFVVNVSSKAISVECNDVAGERLVESINERVRREGLDCQVRFVPLPGSGSL